MQDQLATELSERGWACNVHRNHPSWGKNVIGYFGSSKEVYTMADSTKKPTKALLKYLNNKGISTILKKVSNKFNSNIWIIKFKELTCLFCGKVHDKSEIARIYGKESSIYKHHCCSAKCYTKISVNMRFGNNLPSANLIKLPSAYYKKTSYGYIEAPDNDFIYIISHYSQNTIDLLPRLPRGVYRVKRDDERLRIPIWKSGYIINHSEPSRTGMDHLNEDDAIASRVDEFPIDSDILYTESHINDKIQVYLVTHLNDPHQINDYFTENEIKKHDRRKI